MLKKFAFIKRISIIFLIMVSAIILSSCQNQKGTKFYFAGYKNANKVPYQIFFDEEYFNNPASEYNPSLASATACLALAGFSSTAGEDFYNSDINVKYFFEQLGFTNYLANEYGISKPTDSSFGVYIASKKIDDYTLIGIAVRGAGYLSEWSSNFNIGNNTDFAEGFYTASEIYLNFLKEYIENKNITGKIKIWTGGYSRGGAAVNLAAGRIDDGLVEGKNILSNKVTYTKDDIYAYSYEAPAGKLINSDKNEIFEKGINYSNIYTIINLNDPVPFVAPRNYNFIRYGTDLLLPDIITDIDYQNHIKKVKKRLNSLSNSKTIGNYSIDTFKDESTLQFLNKINSNYTNMTPHIFINDLIEQICLIIGNKQTYVDYLEPHIRELFKFIYSNLKPKESIINLGINLGKSIILNDENEVVLYDLQHNPERLISDLEPLIYSALQKVNLNLTLNDAAFLCKKLVKLFSDIIFSENGFTIIRALINANNIKALGSAHIPELLLSHITSLDNNYSNNNLTIKDSYNKLYINTQNDYKLYINDIEYVSLDNSIMTSQFVTKKDNDGYLILLPNDVKFEIKSDSVINYSLYNHNNKYLNDVLIETKTI